MLVLGGKKKESIVINDDITLVVIVVRGEPGDKPPAEVPGHPREASDVIRRNEAAGGTGAGSADATTGSPGGETQNATP